MEKPPTKKESGINRIVGFDKEKEVEILGYFKSLFEGHGKNRLEKDKTAELEGIIARINEKMSEFMRSYGVEAVSIPPKNIHVVDKSKLSPEELEVLKKKYDGIRGVYLASTQGLVSFLDYQEGEKLSFVNNLVHEMLHVEGFYSYQKGLPESFDVSPTINKDGGAYYYLSMRRFGFSIGTVDRKKWLFDQINETVITELAIRFGRRYFYEWPELAQEIEKRDGYIENVVDREDLNAGITKEDIGEIKEIAGKIVAFTYSYHEERKKFNSLIDDLYNKNSAEFASREGIFELFAKATMTGRLLPIARLIEKTYGKGSFRRIGEKTQKVFGK